MRYNRPFYLLLRKYLKETHSKWCILGITENAELKWDFFIYDRIDNRKRNIKYLLDLMLEHRLYRDIFSREELEQFISLLPKNYKEKFTIWSEKKWVNIYYY